MKNLNKKISAVALASMVVLGGVVASGVSSFAASGVSSSINSEKSMEDALIDGAKLNREIRKLGYWSMEVLESSSKKSDLVPKLDEYDKFKYCNKSLIRVNDQNLSKFLRRRNDAVIVKYNNSYHLIVSSLIN